METSQSLAIESFSYSWLLNPKPSLHGLEDMSYLQEEENFNFDMTPITHLHYADELFSNGFIKTIDHVDHSSIKSRRVMTVSSPRSTSFSCSFLFGKLGKISVSKKIMRKYVELLLKPLCRKLGASRKSRARVDDIDRREKIRGSRNYYYYWCDMESPIHDAVLHCKRSIGK